MPPFVNASVYTSTPPTTEALAHYDTSLGQLSRHHRIEIDPTKVVGCLLPSVFVFGSTGLDRYELLLQAAMDSSLASTPTDGRTTWHLDLQFRAMTMHELLLGKLTITNIHRTIHDVFQQGIAIPNQEAGYDISSNVTTQLIHPICTAIAEVDVAQQPPQTIYDSPLLLYPLSRAA